MKAKLATILILIYILQLTLTQDPPVSSITLLPNTITQYSQQSNEYKYFQTTIQNPSSQQILLITVSADIDASIQIFVITSQSPGFSFGKWPTFLSASQQCFYSSLNTCALQLMDQSSLRSDNLTVYFTIYLTQSCNYVLDISLQSIYPIKVGYSYSVNFENAEAAVMQLSKQNFAGLQQIVVTCIYSSWKQIGHFQLIVSQGELPNTNYFGYKTSKSLNAFTQILKLKALESNSSYFIMLEGSNDTRFNLSFVGVESTINPSLEMNSTLTYLTQGSLDYTYNGPITNTTQLPLFINLYTYRGYGKFSIDYCQNLSKFSFQNLHGQNGQIIISPQLRNQCYQSVSGNGILLLQDIIISVQNVELQFGFSIGLYEGVYQKYLMTGMKEIGELGIQEEEYLIGKFSMAINYTVIVEALLGNFTLIVNDCVGAETNCTKIISAQLSQINAPIKLINFTCQPLSTCKLSLSTIEETTDISKFSLLLSYQDSAPISLQPSVPITSLVEMNEYVNYVINLTELYENGIKIGNASALSIRNTIINGDAIMLTSFTNDRPTLKDCFKYNSDVESHWQGISNVILTPQTLNITQIYISIFGNAQTIYHLQYTLNLSANIPAAYTSLVDNTQNTFILTSQSPFILLKYTPHILPYSITFSTSTVSTCIKYGYNLPIPNTCVDQLPNNFSSNSIYFNISESIIAGGEFKLSIFVNSGVYKLEEDKTILVSCLQQCYKLISIQVANTATIIHNGDGQISQVGTEKTASNQPLTFTCDSCTIVLNATLRYWGQMQISFQSNSASQVQWRTKTVTLPDYKNPKYFFMKLSKYASFYNFIFTTEAADVTIYTSIITLNESNTNTIDYQYPSSSNFMDVSYGDPLQELHVVNIDNALIQSLKCKQSNFICIATFTVELNTSVMYNWEYLSKGMAHFSANTYEYDISPSWPVFNLEQYYSVSYFTHKLSSNQSSRPVTIHIQPISNCRPQIQTQSTQYLLNTYTDIRLPKIMPGQTQINYRVVSNFACVFSTAITTAPFEVIFPDIVNQIELQQGQQEVVLVYQNSYFKKWSIRVGQKVASIIVGQLNFQSDSQGYPTETIQLPTLTSNLAYAQNTSTLQLQGQTFTEYIIVIRLQSPSPKSKTMRVTPQQSSHSIITLHNQQQIYTYNPFDNSIDASNSGQVQYFYYTTNSFYLFAEINRLKVSVTVSDTQVYSENSTLLQTILTNTSSPWLLVNLTSTKSIQNMRKLRIVFKYLQVPSASTTSTIKMHIQQTGISGLTQIFEGVSIYDAFTHSSAMNCYMFKAPLILGEKNITVDLNFVNFEIENETKAEKLSISGMASLEQSISSLNIKQAQIGSTTYRMILNFYPGSTYKVCFILSSPSLVGEQYSILVNTPSTPMVYLNQYSALSEVQAQSFTTYQYINHMFSDSPQFLSLPITLTVVSCTGNTSILASSSYTDLLTGKMTDISVEWVRDGVSIGIVDVPHGYYYFGVKNIANGLFRTSVQNAPVFGDKAYILNSIYSINWNLKASIGTIMQNDVQYVRITVPGITKSPSAANNIYPIKIVYSLYLLNQFQNDVQVTYPYTIETYTRCPNLFTAPSANPTLKFIPIQTQTSFYPNTLLTSSLAIFNVPVQKFAPESNISLKAQVFFKDQLNKTTVIEYYYGEEDIRVLDENLSWLWSPIQWFLYIIFIIAIILSIAFALKIYKKKQQGTTINFEMAENQFGQQMQARENQGQVNQAETNNNNTQPSHRKPLNASAGYGEFIDQV